MPCWSKIETQITNAAQLGQALSGLGYAAVVATDLLVSSDGKPLFNRKRVGDTFASVQYKSDLDAAAVSKIGKKYAEVGVRTFAKKHGYMIQAAANNELVLVKRG